MTRRYARRPGMSHDDQSRPAATFKQSVLRWHAQWKATHAAGAEEAPERDTATSRPERRAAR